MRRFGLHGDLVARQVSRQRNIGSTDAQKRKEELAEDKDGNDGSENELSDDGNGCRDAEVCELEPGIDQGGCEVAHLGIDKETKRETAVWKTRRPVDMATMRP